MSYQLILNSQDDFSTVLIELEHGYQSHSDIAKQALGGVISHVVVGKILTFREHVTRRCFRAILDMTFTPKGTLPPRIKYRLVGPCGNEASGEAIVLDLSMDHDVDDETDKGEMVLRLSVK